MGGGADNRTGSSRRFLYRGESMVASTGLAVAAILLLAMAGAGWWALYTQQGSLAEARQQSIHAMGALLAPGVERLINDGELTTLRTLLVDVAREKNLQNCSLLAPDGTVVADSDPSRITLRALPESFAPSPPPEPEPAGRGSVTASFKVKAAKGNFVLVLTGPSSAPLWTFWKAQAGIGAVGVLGMLALLLVYRRMRVTLRGVGAVREALLEYQGGESCPTVLSVGAGLGAEADAWNRLIADLRRFQDDLAAERARQSVADRQDFRGDLIQACDAMWQGLVLLDDQLTAQYANGAAAVFLRTKREAIVGRRIADVVTDSKVLDAVRTVAAGQVRTRTTVEVKRDESDGGGVLRFSVRPVRRDDSAAAIVMIEDVTQQRVADEARNAFVAQATHELRTPLTNIRLYVEQALEDGTEDAALRAKALNVINTESRRLERIVGDMLSVAEIEAGSFKLRAGDVRLDALFVDVQADFEVAAREKNIALAFHLPPKFPVFKGDRDKIVLALHNLVGNAIKYTPEGGKVDVKIDLVGDRLVIDVADTGIGVSEEECELVFERFYRSRDGRVAKITGTGLGLALAREVVRMHGGDITLRSQLNQGSTFTLSLPLRAEAA